MNTEPTGNIELDLSLPEPMRTQVMVARMRALYRLMQLTQQEVEILILATPTGDERNYLTDVNLHNMVAMNLLAAVANKKEKPDQVVPKPSQTLAKNAEVNKYLTDVGAWREDDNVIVYFPTQQSLDQFKAWYDERYVQPGKSGGFAVEQLSLAVNKRKD